MRVGEVLAHHRDHAAPCRNGWPRSRSTTPSLRARPRPRRTACAPSPAPPTRPPGCRATLTGWPPLARSIRSGAVTPISARPLRDHTTRAASTIGESPARERGVVGHHATGVVEAVELGRGLRSGTRAAGAARARAPHRAPPREGRELAAAMRPPRAPVAAKRRGRLDRRAAAAHAPRRKRRIEADPRVRVLDVVGRVLVVLAACARSRSKSRWALVERIRKKNLAQSAPTSSIRSRSVTNSPARLLIFTGCPPRQQIHLLDDEHLEEVGLEPERQRAPPSCAGCSRGGRDPRGRSRCGTRARACRGDRRCPAAGRWARRCRARSPGPCRRRSCTVRR